MKHNGQNIYFGQWENKEQLINEFYPQYMGKSSYSGEFDNRNILFAAYNIDWYGGECYVLWEENGKLFDLDFSHCSCFGLEEGRDSFVEVSVESLRLRLSKGKGIWLFENYRKEISEVVENFAQSATFKDNRKWVSVKDKLPNKEAPMWIMTDYGGPFTAWWERGNFYDVEPEPMLDVTHWCERIIDTPPLFSEETK